MAFPIEEKFIEIAEAELGVKFPESTRNKMMKLNGGSVQSLLQQIFLDRSFILTF